MDKMAKAITLARGYPPTTKRSLLNRRMHRS